jgi:hypothetical protein
VRWLTLYLRSRRAPTALAATGGCAALMWSAWTAFSTSRDVDPQLVVLTILLMVAALTATLSGPDDALDRTSARSWPPLRAAHLLTALAVVIGPLLATLLTGARFGPAALVVRDAAGLLGLTALSAATIGAPRAWFMPLGWTLAAVVASMATPATDRMWGGILTWQSQLPDSRPAAVTAAALAVIGLIAYTVVGPARRPPAEAAL